MNYSNRDTLCKNNPSINTKMFQVFTNNSKYYGVGIKADSYTVK